MDAAESEAPDRLLLAQAGYYVVTGAWPLLSPGSFQMVTGPKADLWLVKTFGLLTTVIGIALGRSALRGRAPGEIRLLAAGSACVLAASDCWYVARRRIPLPYLVDAATEGAFAVAQAASKGKGAL